MLLTMELRNASYSIPHVEYQTKKFFLIADIDLFNFIRASNPTKVKTGTRPQDDHEVPLLTITASRVIEMEDLTVATDSSGMPSTIERSPLDFDNENISQQLTRPEDQGQEAEAPEVSLLKNVTTMRVAPEAGQAERIAVTGPPVIKELRKRGNDGVDTNAPFKVLRRDHANSRLTQSAPMDVRDINPLSFADPQSHPIADVDQSSKGAALARDPESKNTSFTSMVEEPESIYWPEWGVTNGCLLDASEACQDLVDHIAPPSDGVAAAVEARENEIKNLETLLEAKTNMKKTTKGKSAELSKELENLRELFSDLQVSNNRLSQQVSTLQAQVIGEEKQKAAFKKFKQYEDNLVEQRYAEMDARQDALSIDFDEELYSHMLTAIAGHRWVIGYTLRLAGMIERLKYGVEHGKDNLSMEAIEAYDPKAEAKYITTLHALKDLKYPIVDQLLSLKDAPTDVIMASLYLESDTEDDAPYRAVKKKKCRVVCRTHEVGSANHARSDGVPVSVSIVAPQVLAILLADEATQTEISEEGASHRFP
uniref:Transposase (Putative), gypsy type n=1 Tax=Tanacetum cinerariifolium TaxID=118510 RepID=A0A699HYG0_TANCI|nr:hypothetical protein [Tanacetum cinerariifolium]